MTSVNFLKPNKDNLNLFLVVGALFFSLGIIDFCLNNFYEKNITAFPWFQTQFTDEIKPFYQEKKDNLFMFNLDLLDKIMILLEESFEYEIVSFEKDIFNQSDSLITPKIKSKTRFNKYTQVFSSKHGFIPNLSILDVLFNLGPNSSNYLKNISLKIS